MTPMIDVVFLLIIFFLVSSHLAKQESRLPLDLPVAGATTIEDAIEKRLSINVDESGQIQVGSAAVPSSRLAELLGQYQSDHDGATAVRLRMDKTLPYRVIEPLLRQVAAVGITDITFAVHQDQN